MSKLEELIQKYCPDGVEYVRLGDVFQVQNGYTPSKSNKAYWDNGTIPWFRLEDIRANGRYLTDAIQHITQAAVKRGGLFKAGSIIISTTATIGEYALIDCDFICNQQITCLTPLSKRISSHFFLHYAAILGDWCKQNVNGAGLAIVPTSKLKDCLIPVPPIPIQEEIVRVLDAFTELQQGLIPSLQAELQKRIQQYNYYRDKLLTDFSSDKKVKVYTLGELGTFTRGNGLQKKDFTEAGVGCIHYGQIYTRFGAFTEKTLTYVDKELASHLLKVEKGNLVIACTSENVEDICKCVAWLGEETICTGGHACVFRHNQNPKYISYFFQTEYFFNQKVKYTYGTKVKDIKPDSIAKIKIPLPSLEEQSRIVSILDNLYTLTTDLSQGLPAEIEKRRKQYEFYRDKLLTFKRKEA